ncbi:hypothetical protein KC349_g8684 [Hortaea werneckii]|nr:hypothetical protein KC349_g8684 [Hortaea werneckii]
MLPRAAPLGNQGSPYPTRMRDPSTTQSDIILELTDGDQEVFLDSGLAAQSSKWLKSEIRRSKPLIFSRRTERPIRLRLSNSTMETWEIYEDYLWQDAIPASVLSRSAEHFLTIMERLFDLALRIDDPTFRKAIILVMEMYCNDPNLQSHAEKPLPRAVERCVTIAACAPHDEWAAARMSKLSAKIALLDLESRLASPSPLLGRMRTRSGFDSPREGADDPWAEVDSAMQAERGAWQSLEGDDGRAGAEPHAAAHSRKRARGGGGEEAEQGREGSGQRGKKRPRVMPVD